MSDYKITHIPDDDHPWKVMDDGLVFDDFDREEDAQKFITEIDECGLFGDRVQMLVEEFADKMDITSLEFIYMVENHLSRTLRGLWS